MPLRKRLRRLHGRLVESFEGSLSADNNPAPPASPANDLGPGVTPQPLGSSTGEQTSSTLLPSQTDPTSSAQVLVQPAGVTVPTAASAGTDHAEGDETNTWPRLKSFLRMLDQSPVAFGPLKGVTSGLVECVDVYEKAANNRQEYINLRLELENIFMNLELFISQAASTGMTASMESFCKSIQNEIKRIQEKQERGEVRRHLEAGDDSDEVLACYQRIHIYLERLLLNLNLSMWKITDELATDARLDRLCSSMAARYNSSQAAELKRGACTPGTRIEVLSQMHNWVHNLATGSVFWLNGMAGTGKTTIAYTLCTELDAGYKLGASFFCSRSLPECRDVNLIIPSIAYQLAQFSRPFRSELSRVLEKERSVHTRLLQIQFESLIVQPLAAIQGTLPDGLVVVIDALDECDNQENIGQILDALFMMIHDLPIKFFVSGRPEPEIRDQMQKQGDHRTNSRIVLHDLDKGTVQGDIEIYLRETLAQIHPTDLQIKTLVQRAGILFIYAATVVRYIGHDKFRRNPQIRLQTIVSASTLSGSSPYKDMDELYTAILKAAIDDPDLSDMEKDDIKQVLYTVICARAPLTISGLSGLLQLHDIGRVQAALRPLWSVLHVVETSGLVTALHASFPDFMFDSKRSKKYHCDMISHDYTLVQYCFDCIKSVTSGFNICGLESSYLPDDKIPNINAKVERAISPELLYACRYWASHLEHDKGSPECIKRLEDLVSTRLLLWMEVMNLKKCMHEGVGVIQQVEKWCERQEGSEDLIQLTHDAWRFVSAYTSSPVSQSTPHIYVSMLPFWPESSPLGKHYTARIRVPAVPQGPAIARRRLDLLATWLVDGEITGFAWSPNSTRLALVADGKILLLDGFTGRTVATPPKLGLNSARSIGYSHDGTRIVSGSEGGMVHIWDSESGRMVIDPLEGHEKDVTSVSFSPDDTRILSGSSDGTIRVWDIQTKKTVLGPLKTHAHPINSVAFAPDGTQIVSGSGGSKSTSLGDNSIYIWDAWSGQLVLGPLQRHTGSVASIAFSPDGTRIISGSEDKTIRVWDIQNGRTVLGPLEGHTGFVRSVGVSPDGTRIVSGSNDTTICVWDAESGKTVLDPLQGHTKCVTSVQYSPDGTRVISGSNDKTICVWNIKSGQAALDPLETHAKSVYTAAFLPDGTRIFSGSDDKTIHVWDIQSGQTVFGPLQGHAGSVTSVGSSPDGSRIFSGSFDYTIRVWDIQTGQEVLDPLKGHEDYVRSVGISLNGTHIASGSDDMTIRIWDMQSGECVLDPLEGHTSWVTSVRFSPDGTRLVSGSYDRTIRVWDTQTGKTVLGPLQGHTDWVNSVGFSPDGTRIVSGSYDTTIRVWDAQTGQTVIGPLHGHTSYVTFLEYSPDGTRIVSGSADETILVWDIQTGQRVFDPFEGHTKWIRSVRFSPDGTRVVSGSDDKTVRVWDIRTPQEPSSHSALCTPVLWQIDSNGWVTDNQSRLLVWVPPDLRGVLLPPRVIFKTSPNGFVRLNFDDVRIGESWDQCYRPV